MKNYFYLAIAGFLFSNVQPVVSQENFISDKLKKLWETPQELKTPESVCYDSKRNILYVSSVDGKPTEKDEKGFISKVNLDGKIVELQWVTGLHAPKGMGIHQGILYVTDIDRLVEIDIEKGKIIKQWEEPNAKFLNDVTIDDKGNVYVSDMITNKIHRLSGGKFEVWLEDERFKNTNGLYAEEHLILVGTETSVYKVDIGLVRAKMYIDNTGGIDGIVPTGDGQYLISDWAGRTHLVSPPYNKTKLSDTTPSNVNAADIEFVIGKKMLLIPTFSDNRVVAYSVQL